LILFIYLFIYCIFPIQFLPITIFDLYDLSDGISIATRLSQNRSIGYAPLCVCVCGLVYCLVVFDSRRSRRENRRLNQITKNKEEPKNQTKKTSWKNRQN
jgi:hypothetical protein